MFGFLFTITVIYLAYVAYDAYQAIVRSEKGEPVLKARPAPAQSAATSPAPVVAKPAASTKPATVAAAPKPAATKQAAAPAKAPTVEGESKLADELRNPVTGEVSAVPANYRFAKKWIKDVLVTEKLLDRVYKPNELDETNSRKAKEAIDKLRAIKKYQA